MPNAVLQTMRSVSNARVMPEVMKWFRRSFAALIRGTPGTMKSVQATMGSMGVADRSRPCSSTAASVAAKAAMAMPA